VISGKALCHGFEMSACNALSRNGLRILLMFTGCLAAFLGTRLRILVDTGANRSFVSQQLIEKHDLKLTDSPVWLKLADGNKALSRGNCKLAFECHDYKATVSMMALKMNSDFDVILGCDWLQKNRADIMFSTDSLHIGCAQSDGQTYDWPIADDGVCHSVKCSMVAADDLKKHLDADDRIFILHVNAVGDTAKADFGNMAISNEIEQSVSGRWQSIVQDLPAELPPERSVFHTIPLRSDEPPPNRKMYRMSRDEMQECERLITMLLQKGFIQRSNSEYGNPVIFVAKKDGSMRMCVDYRALNK